ncbi:MAG: hypothetical protein EZS28_035644, partial [Streblomastix strix]
MICQSVPVLKRASGQNSPQSLNSKCFCVANLLHHFKFKYQITLGFLTKSYPLFYHVRCAVPISLLCN